MNAARRRLWVVSELYHPEETSTGYFATGLAEGLAAGPPAAASVGSAMSFDVRVLCSQPTYSARGTLAPALEVRNGVTIRRCASTRLDKDRMLLRVINLLTITLSIGWAAWRGFRRGDLVLVVTNPPTLPFAIIAAARARGARVVLRLEDIYPDVLVATGALAADSTLTRALRTIGRRAFRHAERVVVLGRDMAAVATSSLGIEPSRLTVIPHWGGERAAESVDTIGDATLSRRLAGRFVVQHMGNMGRTHGVEDLAAAAVRLRGREDLHFLFIGWGARREAVERIAQEGGLDDRLVTIKGPVPRAEVAAHLGLADLSVIAFRRGMAGVSVPSRMYDVMAAGKPILAVADEDSELARVVREEGIGWVSPPGDVDALVAAIERAAAAPRDELSAMGDRARAAAAARYTRAHAIARYRALLESK